MVSWWWIIITYCCGVGMGCLITALFSANGD